MHWYVNDSENERWIRVDLLESCSSALVHDALCFETVILIEIVLSHALSEGTELGIAEIFEDFLSGRAIILSWEAVEFEKVRKLFVMILTK